MKEKKYETKKEFRSGLKDGIPIALGYFAVSFSLGISMVAAGISSVDGAVMSLTNLTSAGEFAGVRYTIVIGSVERYLYKDAAGWYVIPLRKGA